jgi:uncharacterized protein YcbK (DUF882 family)
MKLNRYFKRKEFACKCGCGFSPVDVELLGLLTQIREKYNAPVNITSACRCLAHNRKIDSQDTSQHVKGLAADFWIKDVAPIDIYNWLDSGVMKTRGGLGVYDKFIHVDVREEKKRWDMRSKT